MTDNQNSTPSDERALIVASLRKEAARYPARPALKWPLALLDVADWIDDDRGITKGVAQTDIPGGRQKSGRPMTDDSRPTKDVVHIALSILDPDMLTSAGGSRVTVALAAIRQIVDPDILKSADEKAPPRIEVPAEAVRGILKD